LAVPAKAMARATASGEMANSSRLRRICSRTSGLSMESASSVRTKPAAVEAGVSQALAAHSLGPIGEALTLLLDASKAEGTIRPDVDARDVILLIGYLTRLEPDEWDARARHLLHVVLDGLRRA
jgi:hypothetical protein